MKNLILILDLRIHLCTKSQHGPQNIKTGHLNLHVSKKYCQLSFKRPAVQIQIFWIQIRNSRPDPKITEDSGFRFLSFRVSGFPDFPDFPDPGFPGLSGTIFQILFRDYPELSLSVRLFPGLVVLRF